MSHPDVIAAVKARLAANWSETVILGENATFETPADLADWISLSFPMATERQSDLGPHYRELGGFQIAVGTQIGSGVDLSADRCERLAALFRNQRFDGVECRMAIKRGPGDDKSYQVATVTIAYEFAHD